MITEERKDELRRQALDGPWGAHWTRSEMKAKSLKELGPLFRRFTKEMERQKQAGKWRPPTKRESAKEDAEIRKIDQEQIAYFGYDPQNSEEEGFFHREVIRLHEKYRDKMKPDAEKLRKRDRNLRKVAHIGGENRAHYTHAQVGYAFAMYRRRNQKDSAWTAANALIREGEPLAKYRRITGLWSLIKRISEGETLSIDDWYNNL